MTNPAYQPFYCGVHDVPFNSRAEFDQHVKDEHTLAEEAPMPAPEAVDPVSDPAPEMKPIEPKPQA